MIDRISIKNFKGRLVYLFFTLSAFVVTQIIFDHKNILGSGNIQDSMNILVTVIVFLVVVSSMYATSYDKQHTIYDIGFLLSFVGVSVAHHVIANDFTEHLYNGITTLILIYTSWILTNYLISSKRVTMDVIYGALSLYILVGIIFATVYTTLNVVNTGLFNRDVTSNDLFYFSFITLTTTGYGDITPISPIVRALVILEALFGVFYVATFVARIISMYDDRAISKTITKKLEAMEERIEDKVDERVDGLEEKIEK